MWLLFSSGRDWVKSNSNINKASCNREGLRTMRQFLRRLMCDVRSVYRPKKKKKSAEVTT